MTTRRNERTALVALDPGGSKCDALVVEPNGTVRRWVHATEPGMSGRSPTIVRRALATARRGLRYHRWQEVAPIRLPRKRNDTWLVHETEAGLHLAGVPWGIVALAGTGARVDGYTRDGRRGCLDGLGPVLGDAGSAYQIGREALRAAARAIQHPRHGTSLKPVVLDYCEAVASRLKIKDDRRFFLQERVHALTHLSRDPDLSRFSWLVRLSLSALDRSVVAGLARLVDEQARAGDAVATSILRCAAGDLATTVYDLADHLGILHESCPCVGMGSVLARSDLYWEAFCEQVRTFAPQFRPVRVVDPPVLGFALAALEKWHGQTPAEVRTRLFETFARQKPT